MNNNNTVSKELEFNTGLIKQALADCQDPAHRVIFEKGLDAVTNVSDHAGAGHLSAQRYTGGTLRFLEDMRSADLAGRLAVVYGACAASSDIHMEKMRRSRDRPELTEAIIAEVHEDDGPVTFESAWKKAGLFHGKINTWLKKHGKKPATQKNIYDRIVKILRT